jgi:hypothetical protein
MGLILCDAKTATAPEPEITAGKEVPRCMQELPGNIHVPGKISERAKSCGGEMVSMNNSKIRV